VDGVHATSLSLATYIALGYRNQMAKRSPRAISDAQFLTREQRVQFLAKAVGFVGNVEYRHIYSQTGGAQYGRGSTQHADLLTVYAEAFERDADPEDFSLEAMIAHERGHQILCPASSHSEARRGCLSGK
jgi:hypothetical protein